MKRLTPAERREIRRSLDGATLNVATYAASLHVGRRIMVRLDEKGRYKLKYVGVDWSLLTTPSIATAIKFLDELGIKDLAERQEAAA